MLSYNEIVPKKFIVMDGKPYEVLTSHVFRKQQRKPVNQTKLRDVKNGKVVEHSFHQSESVKEAEIEKRNIKYLYTNRGEFWFSEESDPSKRYSVVATTPGIDNVAKFTKQNSLVTALSFNDEIIGFTLPIKVELQVKDAPPSIAGNTAQGGTKQVTLETGASVNTPLFINAGDIIRINTETGQYTERVEKN